VSSRRFSTWQKVAALAPVLLLLVYLPGETLLRCRADGQLRATCCCPQDQDKGQEQPQASGPALKAQSCCARETTASERPTAETAEAARRLTSDVSAPLATLLPVSPLVSALAAAARPAPVWQAQGPPGDGPPLVLLKHAFLI
jgi:hypothetical protein